MVGERDRPFFMPNLGIFNVLLVLDDKMTNSSFFYIVLSWLMFVYSKEILFYKLLFSLFPWFFGSIQSYKPLCILEKETPYIMCIKHLV